MTTRRFSSTSTQIAILLGVYFFSRCYNLLLLPMVYDEAIYLRWAHIINAEPAKALISALDGKTPLFFMLNAVTLALVDDMLLSARILSVAAGALTVLGLYAIGHMLFSRRTAFLASLIYVCLPYSLIHDRIGLVDSMLTACGVATLAFSILLARHPENFRSLSVALGAALGLGFLTKTPHLIFWIYPPLAFGLLGNWRDRRMWQGLILAGAGFLILSLPYLLYESPQAPSYSSKILHYKIDPWGSLIQTLTLQNPRMMVHLGEYADSMWIYLTWPVLFLFVLGAALQIVHRDRRGGLLLAWALIPSIPFLMMGKMVYARYFLITIPPFALVAAVGLEWAWQKLETTWPRLQNSAYNQALQWGSVMVLLIPAWWWNVDLLTRPIQARWTGLDYWQYVRFENGPAAVQDAVRFFKREARNGPVYVFLTFKPGIPSDALYLYLKDTPSITVADAWFGLDLPQALDKSTSISLPKSKYEYPETAVKLPRDALTGKPIYFVSNTVWYKPDEVLRANPGLRIVKTYEDPMVGFFSFNIYKKDPLPPPAS